VGVIEDDWAPSPLPRGISKNIPQGKSPPVKGGEISGYSAVSAAERFIFRTESVSIDDKTAAPFLSLHQREMHKDSLRS